MFCAAAASRAADGPGAAPLPPAGQPQAARDTPARERTRRVFSGLPQGAAERLPTPADAIVGAAKDAAAAGKAAHSFRYLALWTAPTARLKALDWLLNLHLNELSREPEITPALASPSPLLLRIDLNDFRIDPEVWERLASADPYFHVSITTHAEEEYEDREQEYGHYEDSSGRKLSAAEGKGVAGYHWVKDFTKPERVKVKKAGKAHTTPALFAWSPAGTPVSAALTVAPMEYRDYAGHQQHTYLVAETRELAAAYTLLVGSTGSACPIVSGEWFIWETAVQVNRDPGYRDFLGFKDRGEFDVLTGFNAKALEAFPLELAESVANSGVSVQKVRAITRKAKIGGATWQTLDVNNPVQDSNPLRVLDPDRNLKFDAEEVLAHLPNGLFASGLFNSAGVAQDVAPQAVALDRFGGGNDYNVHVGTLSCNRCHERMGRAGLADIRPWVRRVLNRPPLALQNAAHDDAERLRLRRLYLSSLEKAMRGDRALVADAVAEATGGRATKDVFAEYAEEWDAYADTSVDLDTACRELGCTPGQFRAALDRLVKATGSVDPVLATYLRPEQVAKDAPLLRGLAADDGPEPIPRPVFLEAYPLAVLAIRGQIPAVPATIKEQRP